jgi:hypothetical protein
MVQSKMNGEIAQVEEKKPKKPVAKNQMDALREMAESLKRSLEMEDITIMLSLSRNHRHTTIFWKSLK